MEKHLHIINATPPHPANYGNVVDRFYKLPALQREGVRIHLHCFGHPEQAMGLDPYCESIRFYPLNKGHQGISLQLPHIVSERKNETLLRNLLQDDHPILMEGMHSTYPLLDARFSKRRCFVRLLQVQHQYCQVQYRHAASWLKKIYYLHQGSLLRQYEYRLHNKAVFWTTLPGDCTLYREQLHYPSIDTLPPFIPDWNEEGREGSGTYCFYHGRLDKQSNEQAIAWLVKNVFRHLNIPFLVAGSNPSSRLEQLLARQPHTCLVANPSNRELQDMMCKAHIHLLPSRNNSGLSCKLLYALFNGRHCIADTAMLYGTGLTSLCHVADTAQQWMQCISDLFQRPFTPEEKQLRQRLLHQQYNNRRHAQQMVQWIWGAE